MKLFLMKVGKVRPPQKHSSEELPVPAYLIETDSNEYILIDTGLSQSLVGKYRHTPYLPHIMDEPDYVGHQLATLGITPQDIRYVICTHFDPDHAGNLASFKNSEIVVQRRLYHAAIKGEVDRFRMTEDQWGASGIRFLLLDGDTEIVPGVTLLESSGHAPGHQSVLINLPHTGPVLLAIDAIPSQNHTDPATRPIEPFDIDESLVRESTKKLSGIKQSEHVALTIYGHDFEQWQNLRLSPDFYD
ncbi:N-acyl homoserine lactonase family protein [Halobacillus shinanisalinarum]|uniref:N-acyl homoserine lactonase family protein n=1 Tax=Halobacillus shinanisalinarum TaxID=2932258 RepID=A0ABY4H4L9_9BACI|nr:N-acyl homoserine lactonase family protein [Halobacillus shinanisalinarum]UOQ93922.1 N-acyl homoserine lactonase family protein [Halobacillus shinanisalinarum]